MYSGNKSGRRSSARLIATSLVLSASGAAMSQTGTLEEVVVTAQKREQSLQDAPIAITAFGSNELEQKGIENITDLGTFAPNVKISPLPSNTAKATIAIRGSVTSNPAITWEPTVGMYMDGVFVGKFSGNTFKIADVERIEVLRGPQGTLYGKNTTGGAVNIVTKKPTGEFGGKVRVGAGNFDYWRTTISLDSPTIALGGLGTLKGKVSFTTEERDGFYDNVPTDKGPISHPFTGTPIPPNPPGDHDTNNALDSEVARVDLLWDTTERLQFRYTANLVDTDNTPAKPQFTDLDPNNTAFGFQFPEDLSQYLLPEDDNVDENTTDNDTSEGFESASHSLFATYDVGTLGVMGDVTVEYIGNTRDLDFEQHLDNDGTPFVLFHTDLYTDYKQNSHEIQLTGATATTDYVLGLYYFEEEADVFNPLQPVQAFFGPGSVQRNRYGFDGEQQAVFGQIEWRPPVAALEDRLALTFGLRWTQEEKDSYISHPDDTPQPFSAEADDKWTNVTPTFIAAYDITREINVYAKYSEGFKAGGFNGESGSRDAFVSGYDPETVKAYELGLKSRFLNNTLQVNGAIFYHDESDLQLSVFTSGSAASSVVRNAGEATRQGIELETIYQPFRDLRLIANVGYLDSEYEEYLEFDPAAGRIVDKSDEKAHQYAPDITANLSAQYTFLRRTWGEMTARLDYSYNDEFVAYINPEQNEALGGEFDSYGLLNGRLTVANIPAGEQGTLEVALWGKNLTDEEYRLNGIPFGPFAVSYFGDPRTYGLDATYRF